MQCLLTIILSAFTQRLKCTPVFLHPYIKKAHTLICETISLHLYFCPASIGEQASKTLCTCIEGSESGAKAMCACMDRCIREKTSAVWSRLCNKPMKDWKGGRVRQPTVYYDTAKERDWRVRVGGREQHLSGFYTLQFFLRDFLLPLLTFTFWHLSNPGWQCSIFSTDSDWVERDKTLFILIVQ